MCRYEQEYCVLLEDSLFPRPSLSFSRLHAKEKIGESGDEAMNKSGSTLGMRLLMYMTLCMLCFSFQ